MSVATTTADRFYLARIEAGLTQVELARRLNIHHTHISHIECGHEVPSLEWLWRAAEAIGCDPSHLDPRLAKRGT